VPVRTFADWNEIQPGFFEADLVAHCGHSAEGAFLHTLVLTDIATAWVECLPLRYRSQHAVVQALEQARCLLPFPMFGLDTDNGSEFLNAEVLAYCEREKITFTRGRAYKKNDQCFVEQKNGAVVRQLVGYDRFEGERAYRQLVELYRGVRLYINIGMAARSAAPMIPPRRPSNGCGPLWTSMNSKDCRLSFRLWTPSASSGRSRPCRMPCGNTPCYQSRRVPGSSMRQTYRLRCGSPQMPAPVTWTSNPWKTLH
jgi:hypothetical protein